MGEEIMAMKKEDSYWKAKVRSPEGLRLISQNFNKTEKILQTTNKEFLERLD